MHNAIELNEVVKYFGKLTAVRNLSLMVPRGSIYGFLGPNGAGKTTTIRILMGILKADAGSVRVLGASEPESIKHRLGYLPEEKGLYKKMRLLDLVAYFGQLKGLSRREAGRRAMTLLEQFGLAARYRDRCETLSKGLGQKLQVLATLIHEPELVVLDEPFSGLDPVNVELIRNTILDLKHQGRTVIVSTHIMEQAEQICDAVMLINHGHKVLNGSLSEIRGGNHNTVVIDYDGDGSILTQLPGVTRVNDAGKHAELVLEAGTSPQELLSILIQHLSIRRFDTREASLHEIFVRNVAGDVSNE